MSALREWLHSELQSWFPTDGSYSDDNTWIHWIGMTQAKYAAYRATDPTHTSCIDFLTHVHGYIKAAGYTPQCGITFNVPSLKNYGYYPDSDYSPNNGDFFCTNGIYGPGSVGHVGVFMEAFGGSGGIKIAGGGDTKKMGFITRDSLGAPGNIQGWLNIDEFYGSSDSDDNPYLPDSTGPY